MGVDGINYSNSDSGLGRRWRGTDRASSRITPSSLVLAWNRDFVVVERLLGGPHLVHCTRSLSPAWAWFTVRGSRRDS